MRFLFAFLLAGCVLVERLSSSTKTFAPLTLVDEFNQCVQERLLHAKPQTLGMSRIMIRPSLGQHFAPNVTDKRDFAPETERESRVLADLESHDVQLGLYVFGAAVLDHDAEALYFRSLKGPGAITAGTPRARWYPLVPIGSSESPAGSNDTLPDWKQIYPIARQAMRSFADGGRGFETQVDSWSIAARPAIASEERCVVCHNTRGVGSSREVKLGSAVGGVLYAYRLK